MTDRYTPWGKRHTGGPRGWNAVAWGIVMGLFGVIVVLVGLVYSTLIIEPPKLPPPWIEVIGLAGVAFFSAFVITMPVAYAWTKYCYDRPPAQTGDNVTVTERPRERPKTVRRPSDFDHRYEQTRGGSNPAWRERAAPTLPDGITAHELREWLFDARDGKATFAVRDSRKGEGGRSRSFSGDLSADDVTANVRAFLDDYDVIEIDGSGQWDWDVMKDPLFDALLRGEGFGVLLPPTESEV